jgi:hypothetical protein
MRLSYGVEDISLEGDEPSFKMFLVRDTRPILF